MGLSDIAVRTAKPRDREYKLSDSGGLYLLVTPSGGKLWRLKFRVHGIERKLSLGKYPELSLSEARKGRDVARAAVETGTDPAAAKRREKVAAKLAAATLFDDVAREYIGLKAREGLGRTSIYSLINEGRLEARKLGRRTLVTTESIRSLMDGAANFPTKA